MRTKNIQDKLDISDLIAVPSRFVRREELFLKPSDLLISSANSWNLVGKTVYVGELTYPATAGGFISIVRPRSSIIDSRYLYHWITCPKTQESIRNCGRQTTNISNLSVERFLGLELPLPNLSEQRRIAAILDNSVAITKKRAAVLLDAGKYLRSAFFNLFGDPVANSKGLPEIPLAELAKVTTGNTPSREIDAYFGNHIEWIKSDNLNTPFHFLTKATEGLSEAGLKVARSVPAGSTLITCIAGSPSCIGNAALADRKVSFNQQINALTPKPGIEPECIYRATLFSKPRIHAASTK
jgi:type I restriction enzyme S subunit